ncbi:MAG: alanine racemase, partial [Acidimicrobiales bacterium]
AHSVGVALAEEAIALREAGIEAPILMFTEPTEAAIEPLIAADVTLALYRPDAITTATEAARRIGGSVPVHLKVDTGMHRVGADPDDAVALCESIVQSPGLRLEGLWTHFAVADDPGDSFTDDQLSRFAYVAAQLREVGIVPPVLHAANSAGAIAHPKSRFDLVRCGIASYGYAPSAKIAPVLSQEIEAVSPGDALRPVLSLKARVHLVRDLDAGERVSYGRTMPLPRHGRVAVVPLGYADGLTRRLGSAGGEVLIGGKRRPICGTVTMDQVIVNCGGDDIRVGDPVVLIGRQGGEEIMADEWAERLGTIAYEVLCGIGSRVPRVARGRVAANAEAPGEDAVAVRS